MKKAAQAKKHRLEGALKVNTTTAVPAVTANPANQVVGAMSTSAPAHDNKSASSETKPKRKKQKTISTGSYNTSTASIDPDAKLYCLCKTPYDESKWDIAVVYKFAFDLF